MDWLSEVPKNSCSTKWIDKLSSPFNIASYTFIVLFFFNIKMYYKNQSICNKLNGIHHSWQVYSSIWKS